MKLYMVLWFLIRIRSLPSWERGLKFPSGALGKTWFGVAPLVGAWIEIYGVETTAGTKPVAPLVGAWIEIIIVADCALRKQSLPSWERGLK